MNKTWILILMWAFVPYAVPAGQSIAIHLSPPAGDGRLYRTFLDLDEAACAGGEGVPVLTVFGRGSDGRRVELPARMDWETPRSGQLVFRRLPGVEAPFTVSVSVARIPADAVSIGDGDRLYSAPGVDRYGSRAANRIGQTGVLNWADVTGDGVPDLLRSSIEGLEVFQNLGTAEEPLFHGARRFFLPNEKGERINIHPSDRIRSRRPEFGDVTGDGFQDLLISADYSRAEIYFGRSAGLHKGLLAYSSADRMILDFSAGGEAFWVDLDGNGWADLLAIARAGPVWWHLNEGIGEDGLPRFSNARALEDESGERFHNSGRMTFFRDPDTGRMTLFYSRFTEPYLYWREVFFRDGVWVAGVEEHRVSGADGRPIEVGTWNQNGRVIPHGSGLGLLVSGPTRLFPVTDSKAWRVGQPEYWVDRQPGDINHHLLEGVLLRDGGGFPYRAWLTHLSPKGWSARGLTGKGFGPRETGAVEQDSREWFGCPDLNEYEHLNAKPVLVDWSGAGLLDLLMVTEHAWRFGYLHHYPGRPGPSFGPENQWVLDGDESWAAFGAGPASGTQAIAADPDQIHTDFLSYPLAETADLEGGLIAFHYRPGPYPEGSERVLFSARLRQSAAADPALECYIAPDGRLVLRYGEGKVSGEPLDWKEGQWRRIEAGYEAARMALRVDEEIYASSRGGVLHASQVGSRFFIGSRPTPFVQPQREFPNRVDSHDRAREAYAHGYIAAFETWDARGNRLARFSFDGTVSGDPGPDGRRLPLGYRTGVAAADFTGHGGHDLLLIVSDGHRGFPAETKGLGEIRWYRNRAPGTHAPDFAPGLPLRYENGEIIRVIRRTQVYARDLNGNGLTDLILTTDQPGRTERPNHGIQQLINVGTPEVPRFSRPTSWTAVEERIHAHHEIHLAFGDLNGDGKEDMIVKTDGGIYFFAHDFLDQGIEGLVPWYE